MNSKRLKKLRRELDGFRTKLGSLTSRELASVALALGRTRANRGKEPTYIGEILAGTPFQSLIIQEPSNVGQHPTS